MRVDSSPMMSSCSIKHLCSIKPLEYLPRPTLSTTVIVLIPVFKPYVQSLSHCHMGFIDPATRGQCCSKPRCPASLMQSIIACEMAAAVETTSSAAGPRGCSEVRSGGIGEVERSWHGAEHHQWLPGARD